MGHPPGPPGPPGGGCPGAASYECIAALAGNPVSTMSARNALGDPRELVGWHRIVTSKGAMISGGAAAEQRKALMEEGVLFADKRVDLKCHPWKKAGCVEEGCSASPQFDRPAVQQAVGHPSNDGCRGGVGGDGCRRECRSARSRVSVEYHPRRSAQRLLDSRPQPYALQMPKPRQSSPFLSAMSASCMARRAIVGKLDRRYRLAGSVGKSVPASCRAGYS